MQLPIFPSELTAITADLGFLQQDGRVYYFHGHLPIFHHGVEDMATFRSYIAQLVVNGTATQVEVAEAFGIPVVTVKRAVKKLREEGTAGFYARRGRRRGSGSNRGVAFGGPCRRKSGDAPLHAAMAKQGSCARNHGGWCDLAESRISVRS